MLFVPADNEHMVSKAFTSVSADAVILDLEDALAINRKDAGRRVVRDWADREVSSLFVRVNEVGSNLFAADLDTVIRPGVAGILLPKAGNHEDVESADEQMARLESARGLPPGSIDMVPIIETAKGVVNVVAICSSGIPRLRRVSFGAGDFTIDVGMHWSRDEHELDWVRGTIAVASRAAGLEAPVDTVFTDLRDDEGFEASCVRGRDHGFQGKAVIHPQQVSVANRVYGVSEDEVEWSRRVLSALAAGEASGKASIRLDDKLLDYAHLRQAKGLLVRWERENRE